MTDIGRLFILFGIVLLTIGIALVVLPKVPFLGKLPGDIFIQKDNMTFYFPIATSILISIILTIVLHLFGRR